MKTTEQTIAANFENFLLVAGSHKFGQLEKMIRKGMRSRSNKISKEVWIKWLTNIVNFQGETAEDVITYLAGTCDEFRELFLNLRSTEGKKFLEVLNP
jgi:hypothetical protein